MRHRRTWLGLSIGVIGVALTLTPLSAASAHSKPKPKHHTTKHSNSKGSNPGSSMCQDIKSEESGNSQVGVDVEKAITSGNFATAKQALLNSYGADVSSVNKALSVIKTAPANVQAAFKNLLSYVQQIKTDIENASSLQGLISSFETLGQNTQIATDGTTISTWATSVCGSSILPTTTTTQPALGPRRGLRSRVAPCRRGRRSSAWHGRTRPPRWTRHRMARAWLQHLRDSVIFKLEGLTADQIRWRPTPTANSLGVIVVHLGYAERLWLRAIVAGETDGHGLASPHVRAARRVGGRRGGGLLPGRIRTADAVLDRAPSFDTPSAGDFRPTTVRWAVFHLIEETARHAGHMDITRELLDGSTGR